MRKIPVHTSIGGVRVCGSVYVVAPVLNVAVEMSVTPDCTLQFKWCSQTLSGATRSILMRIRATDHIRATEKETEQRCVGSNTSSSVL